MSATGSARAHTRWELGYQLWYTTYQQRVFDVVGPSVNHFSVTKAMPLAGAAGTDTYWATVTPVEVGAGTTEVAATNTAGVSFRITNAGNEYDGANIQASGAAFTLAANKPLWFGAKVALDEATSSDFYVGLGATRTAFMTAAAHTIHASTINHTGFVKLEGGTSTLYTAEKAGAVSSSSAGTMDTSAHIYEMYWNGSVMTYYLDGSAVGTVTSIPIVAMRPTMVYRNGSSSVQTCDVYWWRTIQIGY